MAFHARRVFHGRRGAALLILVAGFLLPAASGMIHPLEFRHSAAKWDLVVQLSGPRVLVATLRGTPAGKPPLFRGGVHPRSLTDAISNDLVSNASLGGQQRSFLGGFEFAWGYFPGGYTRYWVVPLWPMALPAALGLVAGTVRRVLSNRPGRESLCRNCGYNLIGNASGRCPECGTPLERKAA